MDAAIGGWRHCSAAGGKRDHRAAGRRRLDADQEWM